MAVLKKILMVTISVAAICVANQAMAGDTSQETQVVVRGVKRAKPADAPPPLELYAQRPHIDQIALSPDGSRLAFTTQVGEMHILAGYRFADHHHDYYKLADGDVSTLRWADNDHILIADSRSATRGTCEASTGSASYQDRDSHALLAPSVTATVADMAAAASNQSQIQSLLAQNQPPRCQYFGVRAENAITSVNMQTGKGVPIGAHIGDAPSLALGMPSRVTVGGVSQLIGPFLEMRAAPSGTQPAQRVFLWTINPETGHGKLIDDGGDDIERETRYVDDWLFTADGTIVARTLYDFLHEAYRIEIRTNGKWTSVLTREISRADSTFAPFLIGLSSDGQSIIVLDSDTHGKDPKDAQRHFHYYALAANGAFSGPLENGDAGQNRPIFDPRSGRLTGFATQADGPNYDIRDPRLRHVFEKAIAAAPPGQTAEVLSVTDDMEKVLIHLTGDEDTGSYYLLDFTTGKSTIIGEDFPQIPTEWIAGQEVFSYSAKDGTNLAGILTLPPKPAQKRLPLIVLPHDGPEGQDSLGFNWLAQALASRGYVVLQPNYRGSEGRGADFVAAGYNQWDGKILSDIWAGVDALVQQGIADPQRVCMIGIGFGGYAAMKAAETGKVQCAASVDGISDAKRYLDWRKDFSPAPDPDAFASLSPAPDWPRTFHNNPTSVRSLARFVGDNTPLVSASAISAPVLLIHQVGDSVVPVAQSRNLYDHLQKAGKHVDYLELKGGDHAPETEAVRLKVLQAVTAFLAANNPAEN